MNKTIDKVCMITGVGDGTGAYTARKQNQVRLAILQEIAKE